MSVTNNLYTDPVIRVTVSLQEKNGRYYAVLQYKDKNGIQDYKWRATKLKAEKGNKRNAQRIAEFLNAHEKVSHVNYAGLPDDKYYALAQKYMNEGRTCGVISFELTGGREAAVRFMDSLKLATIATHVAASKTMILHPASHTHRQMNDEQLAEAGVSPGMIRLSVGIENVDDIIADIEQALQNA